MKHILTFFVLGVLSFGSFAQAEIVAPALATPEIVATQTVLYTDLEIQSTGTLPTSFFYFFKEWKRGVERLFTRNTLKKAELEIRISNEKLAEALAVEKARPNDAKAFHQALKNYQGAEMKIQHQLLLMKEDPENLEVKDMLARLDKQSLLHAEILFQAGDRWETDPYAEDAARGQSDGNTDLDLIALVIKDAQSTRVDSWAAIVGRQADVKQRAEAQLIRAESEYNLLKVEVTKFITEINAEEARIAIREQGIRMAPLHSGIEGGSYADTAIAIREQGVRKTEIAIDEPGVHRVDKTSASDASAGAGSAGDKEKTAPVRIDNTPARISTNMTIERQTPKRDFGDRMKAGLDQAGGMLAQGKSAFAEGKFGEAFGSARAAEVLAKNIRRAMAEYAIKEQGVKSVNPLHENTGGEAVNPLHESKDQVVKICHPSASETCDNGMGSERPAPPSAPTEPKVVPVPTLPMACTQEAKICPDGTSVGRSGPRCEFTACPEPKPTGMMCTAQYDPVCGADGKTYGNSCMAGSAGVSVVSRGECGAQVELGTEGGVSSESH